MLRKYIFKKRQQGTVHTEASLEDPQCYAQKSASHPQQKPGRHASAQPVPFRKPHILGLLTQTTCHGAPDRETSHNKHEQLLDLPDALCQVI